MLGVGKAVSYAFASPGAFAEADDQVVCDFDKMQLGNQTGLWRPDAAAMKHKYDQDLKGQEIAVFFIGKTKKGECNDMTDSTRKCWFRSRLLNDVECDTKAHCLHYVAHDGAARHNYTCPTWVRDSFGRQCKLPVGWQACPEKFTLKRVDSGIPQKIKAVLRRKCPGSKTDELKAVTTEVKHELEDALMSKDKTASDDSGPPAGGYPTGDSLEAEALEAKLGFEDEVHGVEAFAAPKPKGMCQGSTQGLEGDEVTMVFHVHTNKWYRCSDELRCEPWEIDDIKLGAGSCGRDTCEADEQCFQHVISSKKKTKECIANDKVWVISDSDDKAKTEAGDGPSLEAASLPLAPDLVALALTLRSAPPALRPARPTRPTRPTRPARRLGESFL